MYEVSEAGLIRKIGSEKLRKLTPDRDGYLRIKLFHNQRATLLYVHLVVLTTFVGPCPLGQQARHLDGNPANNSISNLRWGTPLENAADKRTHGTMCTAEKHGRSKLTWKKVRLLRRLFQSGDFSQETLAKIFQVSQTHVSEIVRGISWKG